MKRIISLIDMDCFYAQVEQRDSPGLWGQPVIVVQHSRQGVEGGILAVSYEARPYGVKRGMTVTEAKEKCSVLNVCHVPICEYADKADIQKYRDASAEVFEVLNHFDAAITVEKASVDEAFLDLTSYVDQRVEEWKSVEDLLEAYLPKLPTSHVANGCDEKSTEEDRQKYLKQFLVDCQTDEDQMRLLVATVTVEEIRAKIHEKTQFRCSAGVGHNKMIAKLVCARHKPRQQTVVPEKYAKEIMRSTPIGDVRGFGGKLGAKIQDELGIKLMGELLTMELSTLIETFPDQYEWLRSIAEGHCDEPVKHRAESSSIAVSKNFPGRSAITTVQEMHEWLKGLTKELGKRLATDQVQNKRTAENLVYSLQTADGKPQKTLKITSYHPDIIFEQVWKAMKPVNKAENEALWHPKVFNISLSASRFTAGIPAQNRAITEWLGTRKTKENTYVDNGGEDILIVDEPAPPPKVTSQPSTSAAPDEIIILDDDDDEIPAAPQKEANANDQSDSDWIEVDGKRISRQAFLQLPPIIKKQYEHRIALESARRLKMASSKQQPTKNGRKRQPNLNLENQNKKQKAGSGQLKAFFEKRT